MREILFRGKTQKEEWRYGQLIWKHIGVGGFLETAWYDPHATCSTIIVPEDDELIGQTVLTKTVGQYTGCTDGEGNKIFADDLHREPNNSVYRIVWSEFFLTWELRPFADKYPDNYVRDLCEYIDKKNVAKDIKIIGNSHDNPELVEKSK